MENCADEVIAPRDLDDNDKEDFTSGKLLLPPGGDFLVDFSICLGDEAGYHMSRFAASDFLHVDRNDRLGCDFSKIFSAYFSNFPQSACENHMMEKRCIHVLKLSDGRWYDTRSYATMWKLLCRMTDGFEAAFKLRVICFRPGNGEHAHAEFLCQFSIATTLKEHLSGFRSCHH